MMMRWLRRPKQTTEIWRGVYTRFDDVPRTGSGFAGDVWKSELDAQLRSVMNGDWSDDVVLEHEALLIVLRMLTAERHVVDFGGGFGATYFYLRQVVPEIPIRYDVIEVPDVVSAARKVVSPAMVTFADQPSAQHRGGDVLFVKSVLQYVEDFRSVARSLFDLGAAYVLCEKFSGVECDSYVSAQVNVRGSSIPYWFISTRELIDLADHAGYACVLRRRLMRHYDQSNFPERLRMGQASTFLFRRR
jgi:putative methyltransferase (TIGR04325 family)